MIRTNDIVLMIVIFGSLLAGILAPDFGAYFQPFPLYLMMLILFLSLLPIRLDDLWGTVRKGWRLVAVLAGAKILLLPVAVFYLCKAIFPDYALAGLLLTGISTGAVAPFISALVGANSALVLVLVVVTSPLVPFTLPVLVKLLAKQAITIPLGSMIEMLALVIFVPAAAVQILRRIAPGLLKRVDRLRFPISLVVFALINLGIFSKYAEFFRQSPTTILTAVGVAFLLGTVYVATGLVLAWKAPLEDRLAGAVIMGNMNNVLVMVFSARFFTPLEPTLAAMYILPFFLLILPLRIIKRRHVR